MCCHNNYSTHLSEYTGISWWTAQFIKGGKINDSLQNQYRSILLTSQTAIARWNFHAKKILIRNHKRHLKFSRLVDQELVLQMHMMHKCLITLAVLCTALFIILDAAPTLPYTAGFETILESESRMERRKTFSTSVARALLLLLETRIAEMAAFQY